MLHPKSDLQNILNKEYGSFIGRTITHIRPLKSSELSEIGWDDLVGFGDIPMVIIFDDGQALIPSQDPEGNGPGFLFTADVS